MFYVENKIQLYNTMENGKKKIEVGKDKISFKI